MARDMKPKRSAPAKKKSGGGTLIGMFIGLVLGVAIAAGLVWYMNSTPMPFVAKSMQPPPKGEAANGAKPQAPAAPAAAPAQPLALPGKPGDPVPEKRFQFYDILPGKTDAVPDSKPAEAPAKKEEAKKEESRQPLYLQAGSFSKPNDADNMKANLAMMGLEASVQQVMVQDKTFYRVRLGPYNRIEDVNKVRTDLAKAGIDASLVKKEP